MKGEHIKVNLPLNLDGFNSGRGEGIWVEVTPEIKLKSSLDFTGGSFFGVLDSDSVYYPELKRGMLIRFELRGVNRAVAFYTGFLSKLLRATDEEIRVVMEKIDLKMDAAKKWYFVWYRFKEQKNCTKLMVQHYLYKKDLIADLRGNGMVAHLILSKEEVIGLFDGTLKASNEWRHAVLHNYTLEDLLNMIP